MPHHKDLPQYYPDPSNTPADCEEYPESSDYLVWSQSVRDYLESLRDSVPDLKLRDLRLNFLWSLHKSHSTENR